MKEMKADKDILFSSPFFFPSQLIPSLVLLGGAGMYTRGKSITLHRGCAVVRFLLLVRRDPTRLDRAVASSLTHGREEKWIPEYGELEIPLMRETSGLDMLLPMGTQIFTQEKKPNRHQLEGTHTAVQLTSLSVPVCTL